MSLLARVTFPSLTGVPKDDVTNTFVFATDADGDTQMNVITAALNAFYNDSYEAGIDSIASRLHPRLSRAAGASEIAFYSLTGHLDGSPMGSPVGIRVFQLDAAQAGNNPLPEEVALCMSFRGDFAAAVEEAPDPEGPPGAIIRPRARHRGRIFLGPLNDFARQYDPATFKVSPNTSFVQQIGKAGDALKDTIDASPDVTAWAVWSRAAENLSPVVQVSVDNALDTMRKRGSAPSLRTVFA